MKKSILIFTLFISTNVLSQVEKREDPQAPPPPVVIVNPPKEENSAKVQRNEIYDFPEVEAEFVGGAKAMREFVGKNFVYPVEAIKEQITGTVYASFVVEKNGKISNITIERGVHPLLDKAVKDMIGKMPKWKPGRVKGKKVRTRCRLPINCTMK